MVHFVGAGPGAPDLITRRGAALLQTADCIIYAGSLVNPALLGLAKAGCAIYNSAEMTLEQVLAVMRQMEAEHKTTVRLHTGDPCLYGAIREQMDALDADGIAYDDTPGVSSFCGAAAALNAEYTLPAVSQTVIITRMEGRTPVPETEKHPRRRGVQGHLAGAENRALHRWHPGPKHQAGGHYQNGLDRGGGFPWPLLCPQQTVRPRLYHRIPRGDQTVNCAYLAFTAKGLALAQQLAQTCPGSVSRCGLGGVTLAGWTAQQFAAADALVFVGAAGIAVRAIAPHCQSKATDPAVVVLDECGRFAVPLLSGHLGGANDLARRLAAACGAVPVITTATDANGLFAVDEWAKKQNCAVWETPRIKFVSGALLAGKTVRYASPWAIAGTPPAGVAEAEEPSGADFALTMTPQGNALHLIPRIGVLGVGCKRGTTAAQLEAAFAAFCADTNLAPVGITAAASIDLKQNEPGLLEFCRSHGWPVSFYSAAQLRAVPGTFSASRFVQGVTGVDNVCERAAVLASGGTLLLPKYAHTGVTFAAAVRPFAPDWRWKTDEA